LSNEERVQWTLGAIIKMKNAGIGDSQKLDKIKHKLENGKPIDSKEILYLREKFDELNERAKYLHNDSNLTDDKEPNENQSKPQSKKKSYLPAVIITLVGLALIIIGIVAMTVWYYELGFGAIGALLILIGIILMIVGGIVAGITRLQRKKQRHLSIPDNMKKQIHQSSPEIKNTGQTQSPADQENEIISVLKMRFAKGEITKEEFDKMKKDLKD